MKRLLIAVLVFGAASPAGANLVGHWRFDEGSGSVAYDSAGDNDGVVSGAQWTTGQIEGALSFDGINDCVALPDNNPIWLPQNNFTLSAWVYFDRAPAASGGETFLGLNYAASGNPSNELGYVVGRPGAVHAYAGRIAFGMHTLTTTDEDLYSNEVLSEGGWYHVVAVRDGTTQAIYLNGELDNSRACSPDPIDFVGGYDDDKVSIGRVTSAGVGLYYVDGMIDDVRIYDSALSAQEVRDLYGYPADGLISHWTFDEGSGSVAYDSAGNNDGVVSGAQWTTGQIGGALEFDGVNDYVALGDTVREHLGTSYTVAAWISADTLSSSHAVVAYRNPAYVSGPPILFQITQVDSDIIFDVIDDSRHRATAISSTALGATNWYHVAGVRDGNTVNVYVNGVKGSPGSQPLGSINANDLKIGAVLCCGGPMTHFFNGGIDDVRIYSRALTTFEIQQLYGQAQNGLVAHWRFDEGSGLIAYDSVGDNDGVVYGAQWTTGQIDGALDFDGSNDYVQAGDSASLDVNGQVTVSAWIKRDVTGIRHNIVAKHTSTSPYYGYHLVVGPANNVGFGLTVDGSWEQSAGGHISSGGWHHVAGTYDGAEMKTFIDGDVVGNNIASGSVGTNSRNLYIGRADPSLGGYFFDGQIDDVRIYGRALSAEEIRELYGAASPAAVYHIDGVAGSDLNDGLSRETAFKTIQKGIEASDNGDEVVVWPGVYGEAINFKGKAIAVKSAAEPPVIEAAGMDAVTFHSGEGPGSVLKNFIIRNSGMAISTNYGSSPTISNLTIVNNDYGIGAYEDSDPNISNCIIWNNKYGDLFGCEARYSWVQQELEPDLEDPNGGLLSHWTFDEGAGLIAYDSAGSKDGVVFGAKWASGLLSGALNFDGLDDYVALPDNNPIWLPQNNFALSAWVYFERSPAASGGETFLDLNYAASSNPSNELGYVVSRAGAGYAGRVAFGMHTLTSKDEDLHSSQVLSEGKWYHVVAVRSGTTQAIYLNGELDSSRACSPDPIDFVGGYDDDKVNIGRVTSAGVGEYYVDGKIDDVRIYGRALSASEVLQLYEPVADIDPLFADPAGGDYHLLSERGRYWPAHDIWVLDRKTSPCIDAGDPAVDPSGEPMPNGGRINIGAYGGTAQASMSEWPIVSDYNRDGRTNFEDLAIFCEEWLATFPWADGQPAPPEPEPDSTPPTPSPMVWYPSGLPHDVWIGPDPTFGWAVAMTSAVASDPSGPVQYYFESLDAHAYDSGWIPTKTYTTPIVGRSGQLLRFRVRARDAYNNETGWSPVESSQPPSR